MEVLETFAAFLQALLGAVNKGDITTESVLIQLFLRIYRQALRANLDEARPVLLVLSAASATQRKPRPANRKCCFNTFSHGEIAYREELPCATAYFSGGRIFRCW